MCRPAGGSRLLAAITARHTGVCRASPGTAVPEKSMPTPPPNGRSRSNTGAAAGRSRSRRGRSGCEIEHPPDAITVQVIEPIEWPDASLGAPSQA